MVSPTILCALNRRYATNESFCTHGDNCKRREISLDGVHVVSAHMYWAVVVSGIDCAWNREGVLVDRAQRSETRDQYWMGLARDAECCFTVWSACSAVHTLMQISSTLVIPKSSCSGRTAVSVIQALLCYFALRTTGRILWSLDNIEYGIYLSFFASGWMSSSIVGQRGTNQRRVLRYSISWLFIALTSYVACQLLWSILLVSPNLLLRVSWRWNRLSGDGLRRLPWSLIKWLALAGFCSCSVELEYYYSVEEVTNLECVK